MCNQYSPFSSFSAHLEDFKCNYGVQQAKRPVYLKPKERIVLRSIKKEIIHLKWSRSYRMFPELTVNDSTSNKKFYHLCCSARLMIFA